MPQRKSKLSFSNTEGQTQKISMPGITIEISFQVIVEIEPIEVARDGF